MAAHFASRKATQISRALHRDTKVSCFNHWGPITAKRTTSSQPTINNAVIPPPHHPNSWRHPSSPDLFPARTSLPWWWHPSLVEWLHSHDAPCPLWNTDNNFVNWYRTDILSDLSLKGVYRNALCAPVRCGALINKIIIIMITINIHYCCFYYYDHHGKHLHNYDRLGWRVGSVVRALDWRSKGWGFESRQEHNKNFEFFRVKKVVLTHCWCAQAPCVCARIQKTMYAC